MYHFLAVDPGKTIGLAYWQPDTEKWEVCQMKDPYCAMAWLQTFIIEHGPPNIKATVEKYAGGGYKTADGIYTTELVGFFVRHLEYQHEIYPRTPLSQQRLSGMGKVQELISGHNIPGPHSHDAFAHAIVHARSIS